MQRLSQTEYLGIGRQMANLLGVCLEGAEGEALRELARAYDPSANESRIIAELFLFHKYLLLQACVRVFPELEVDHVVEGFFAALDERAGGLEFTAERKQAMEQLWQLRARQFDQPFTQDRVQCLDADAGPVRWKGIITRFCHNVREVENPPDIWSGTDGPAQAASRSVTAILDHMVSALGELYRFHLSGAGGAR